MTTREDDDGITDRGRSRRTRAALTSITNIAGRAITLVTSLATIPVVLEYLDQERFGFWMTVSSLTALLGFADLGIGNGVLTAVADAHGRNDRQRIREVTSSATSMLMMIAALILLAAAFALPTVDWARLFGLTSDAVIREAPAAVMVFALFFALNIPMCIVARVQLGLQQGYIAGAWQAAGSIAGLVAVLVSVYLKAGLPWMVAALLGGPLVASILNSAVYFTICRPDLRPSMDLATAGLGRDLLRLGGLFLVLQVAVSLAFASDNFIVAQVLGAQAVADFAVAARLFGVTSVLLGILLQPLWPAYGEAIARRDLSWVRRTLTWSTIGAVILALSIAGSLLLSFEVLTSLWLHRALHVSSVLLVGFGLWTVIEAAGNSLSMFLNGARVVGIQVVLASAFALVCVVLKIAVVKRLGVVGLPWATIISYLLITLIPTSIVLKRILVKL